jgi:hypothetical protein
MDNRNRSQRSSQAKSRAGRTLRRALCSTAGT